jgi:hypothetical protein
MNVKRRLAVENDVAADTLPSRAPPDRRVACLTWQPLSLLGQSRGLLTQSANPPLGETAAFSSRELAGIAEISLDQTPAVRGTL